METLPHNPTRGLSSALSAKDGDGPAAEQGQASGPDDTEAWTARSAQEPVWVAGLGACTAVGRTAAASAAAVRARISRVQVHLSFTDSAGNALMTARAGCLDEELRGGARLAALAAAAATEALASLPDRLKHDAAKPLPLFLGLPAPRPGLDEPDLLQVGGAVAQKLPGQIRLQEPQVFLAGHAAGLLALKAATEEVGSGRSRLCLVGGVDSYLQPETLTWLEEQQLLLVEGHPWGFVPGEGAGFCVLCCQTESGEPEDPLLGRVAGAAAARETGAASSQAPCTGQALARAIRGAIVDQVPGSAGVQQIICDLNGDPRRGAELGYARLRTGELLSGEEILTTPADCWGDVGAASGPLFVALACAGARRGYRPGPLHLLWACSEGGERCTMLLDTVKVRPTTAAILPSRLWRQA